MPSNVYVKAPRFVNTALGLLDRDTVIAHTITLNGQGDFAGAEGDVINIKIDAYGVARKRTIRGGASRTDSFLARRTVPVELTDNLYHQVPLTDAELTLDIESFETEVIVPHARAIIRGIEDEVADEVQGAEHHENYAIEYDEEDPVAAAFEAAELLSKARVPQSQRTLAVGSTAKRYLLTSDKLIKASNAGDNSALRRAEIGQIAGVGSVIEVPALDPLAMYMYHESAYVLGLRAPVVPPDVQGAVAAFEGFALRLAGITNQDLVYNSNADVFIGTGHVKDAGEFDADGKFTPAEEPDPDGLDQVFIRAVKMTAPTT